MGQLNAISIIGPARRVLQSSTVSIVRGHNTRKIRFSRIICISDDVLRTQFRQVLQGERHGSEDFLVFMETEALCNSNKIMSSSCCMLKSLSIDSTLCASYLDWKAFQCHRKALKRNCFVLFPTLLLESSEQMKRIYQ